jgi:hypothetical protein
MPEAMPSAEFARAALLACISAPVLLVRPDCGLRGVSKPAPVVCVDLSPKSSPDVSVLSIIVVRGPYDLAQTLGIPSMQTILDAGTPESEATIRMYRDFEGPRFEPLADGRRVRLESRGLMLGGVVHWATLASPKGTFTTVSIQQIPLHDAPLADSDRSAVEGWKLGKILACLDGGFWPQPARR